MMKEKVYATWPQVIFVETTLLLAIIFVGVEYLTTEGLSAIKSLVLISLVSFTTSLYLSLSAHRIFPLMVIEKDRK